MLEGATLAKTETALLSNLSEHDFLATLHRTVDLAEDAIVAFNGINTSGHYYGVHNPIFHDVATEIDKYQAALFDDGVTSSRLFRIKAENSRALGMFGRDRYGRIHGAAMLVNDLPLGLIANAVEPVFQILAEQKGYEAALRERFAVLGLPLGTKTHDALNILSAFNLRNQSIPQTNSAQQIPKYLQICLTTMRRFCDFLSEQPIYTNDLIAAGTVVENALQIIQKSKFLELNELKPLRAKLFINPDAALPGLLTPHLVELIRNAYTQGADMIELKTIEPQYKSNFIGISIANNGRPIHPDNLEKIFFSGFTLRPSDAPAGTGMGLQYLLREATSQLNWAVSVSTVFDGVKHTLNIVNNEFIREVPAIVIPNDWNVKFQIKIPNVIS